MHLANERAVDLEGRANTVLNAHEQAVQDYTRQAEAPDWYPFVVLPTGTEARELPDGGRLFILSDGAVLVASAPQAFPFIDPQGNQSVLTSQGKWLHLPDGRTFELADGAPVASTSQAGIEGLPHHVGLIDLGHQRYRGSFPDFDLIVDHPARVATVINETGTVLILGSEIRAVGEAIQVHPAGDGGRGFHADSGHAGLVELTGDIRLSAAGGVDLVIRFPVQTQPEPVVRSPGPFRCSQGEPV
ncbi:hypothetical protein [Sulfidibacter corallicola]|uniref:Uncharacterized protein n=1 Tax=Sulfidibacter corallicola TaxID=2818388 RepID=A0A8A4TKE3_SULCO|nr:hypothetical protein [Sulfidibacter corallicola]QTD49674.1 hypothetical protein J3U87_29170 [Sulfidibacter corallicola]